MYPRRFAELREAKGITQEELADMLSMSKRAIAAWESGERKPPIDKLEWLADYYSVTTDYLLGRTEIPNMYAQGTVTVDGNVWDIFSENKTLLPNEREQVERQIHGAMEDDQRFILQGSSHESLEELVRRIAEQVYLERDKQNENGSK